MDGVERSGEAKMPRYDCLLFDLDDTLYPPSTGIQLTCRKNIAEYMAEVLKIDESKVQSMCFDLYKSHGSTMAGLKELGYEFDNDEFHSFVHGKLPYENLSPDPILRSLLLSIPQRKIIFTNADKVHATKTLSRLGLEDCFEGIICFETLNPSKEIVHNSNSLNSTETADNEDELETVITSLGKADCSDTMETTNSDNSSNSKSAILCKPSLEAIELALKIANADPKRTIFFDDTVRNIEAGKAAGLHTVVVGSSVRTEGADFALESIHNIKEALPEIWENEEKSEIEVYSCSGITVETLVVA